MSHQPERKEKNCLNCDAQLEGRYCHICGQENIVPKQNFWSLIQYFIYDIFHFDGKFFDTLKGLFTRPGKLSKEYVEGKRAKYLDPIRMYLFTSAVFFIFFFSLKTGGIFTNTGEEYLTPNKRYAEISRIALSKDSADLKKLSLLLDTTMTFTVQPIDSAKKNGEDSLKITLDNKRYFLIPEKRDMKVTFGKGKGDTTKSKNWFIRKLQQRFEERTRENDYDFMKVGDKVSNEFLHRLPYLLFISLPIFALLLKLLYVRRKNYYYSDHAVFTLHHYILSFILFLFFFLVSKIEDVSNWSALSWLKTIIVLSWLLYLYIAMKRFYQQSYIKTFFKFLLLNFLGFIVLLLLFIIFLLFSFLI